MLTETNILNRLYIFVNSVMSINKSKSQPRFEIVESRIFFHQGNILFNHALNTFYLWLYGVGYRVKNHSDSKRRKPAATWATLLISSKGSFICTIPWTG